MTVNVVVERKIRIDGKDYESLDDVPADKREAVAEAIANEVPPALQDLVNGALSGVVGAPGAGETGGDAISPEPLISERVMIVLLGVGLVLLASLVWLVI